MHPIHNRYDLWNRRNEEKRKTSLWGVLAVLGGMFIWFFYAIIYISLLGGFIYTAYHFIHKYW